jgi:hypothetical protein
VNWKLSRLAVAAVAAVVETRAVIRGLRQITSKVEVEAKYTAHRAILALLPMTTALMVVALFRLVQT